MGMNELRKLLEEQYRRYMNRMQSSSRFLRWRTPYPWELKKQK